MTVSRFWANTSTEIRIGKSRGSGRNWATSLGGAAAWTPADDANLTKWLAQGDWTKSGSNITQWNDSSSFARHVSQGTASLQPLEAGSGVTLAAQFDGVDDIMTGTPHMFAAGSQSTFIVLSDHTTGSTDALFMETSTATDRPLYTIHRFNSTRKTAILIRNDASTAYIGSAVNTASVAAGAPTIYETVDTGSNFSFVQDGASIFSNAYTRTGVYSINILSLGARSTFSPDPTPVKVHEVICTTATDAPTLLLHREYLAAKFGVTL